MIVVAGVAGSSVYRRARGSGGNGLRPPAGDVMPGRNSGFRTGSSCFQAAVAVVLSVMWQHPSRQCKELHRMHPRRIDNAHSY